jgi:hypothetical protein
MDDAEAAATYNEMRPAGVQRPPIPIGGDRALFDAMMRQRALQAQQAASAPRPGQGQLSPMLPRTPQQQALAAQGLQAALIRRAQEEARARQMQQMQMPGGMPPPQ